MTANPKIQSLEAISALQILIYDVFKRHCLAKNRRIGKVFSMGVKNLLGAKVKQLRKMQGYTQEKFAELIDITPRNLNRIESGENFVTSETLDKILQTLDISADILFSFEHLKDEKEIINEIYNYINVIRLDTTKLKKAHRILRILAEDDF